MEAPTAAAGLLHLGTNLRQQRIMPGWAEAQPGCWQAQQFLVRLVGVQGAGLQQGGLLREAAAQLWRQPLQVVQDLRQGLGVCQRAVRCCVGDTKVLCQVACRVSSRRGWCDDALCTELLQLCVLLQACLSAPTVTLEACQ